MFILAPLARPPVAGLWTSQVLTGIGEELYRVTLIWLATAILGSAAGLVSAAQQVSVLLVGLIGGVLVDRWGSRRSMIGADCLRILMLMLVPLAAAAGGGPQLWSLFLLAIVVSGLRGIYQPALQSALPRLPVSAETLLAANGLLDATRRMARIVGPSLAGMLAVFLAIEQFFLVVAGAFAVSAIVILSLRRHLPLAPISASRSATGAIESMRLMLRELRGHVLIGWALMSMSATNICWTISFSLGLTLLVQRMFPGDVGVYGLVVAAYGVGNLLGNFVIGGLSFQRQLHCIFPGRVVLGLGFIGLALAPSVPLLMLSAAFAALGGTMGDLPFLGLMQREFPIDQIGRLYGLRMTVESAGGLAGSILAAPLLAGLPAEIVIGGSGAALVMFGVFTTARMRSEIGRRG